MAGKMMKKDHYKGKETKSDSRDDLDLRDEILNLKRELAAVRREREKLAIRLRKCENEVKKKDRQINQLMDPSQNAEMRELLSMKGAAMLLNIRDQNNALVQMLLEKNQQIKRMSNEIKTAKLYSKTSKNEPYRSEITRLRSMLLLSQEALKEAAQGPQMPCVSEHSRSSYSSSESGPSSQELDELRFMVQSLETHMQYSKELLKKKNQEIATLSQELESSLDGRCCHWKMNIPLKYDKARRCASASVLEPFQGDGPSKTTPERGRLELKSPCDDLSPDGFPYDTLFHLAQKVGPQRRARLNTEGSSDVNAPSMDLELEKITNGYDSLLGKKENEKRSKKSLLFAKTRNTQTQVDLEELIPAREELVELDGKGLSGELKRSVEKTKKSLGKPVTGKAKNRNIEKNKMSGKEKWKFALHKVQAAQKPAEKISTDKRQSGRKIHTNPGADDDQVWEVINRAIQNSDISVSEHSKSIQEQNVLENDCESAKTTEGVMKYEGNQVQDSKPTPMIRKLSLPVKLSDVITHSRPISTPGETDDPSLRTLEAESTPRDNETTRQSVDSEDFRKSFEVEAVINEFGSISSRAESVMADKTPGFKSPAKNCTVLETSDCDSEGDDDDVITI